jgi:hypothetical protein
VRRQRLVRRGDARRRSRARDGDRRARHVLRGPLVHRHGLPRVAAADRRRQQGVDRDQLVGRPRSEHHERHHRGLRADLQAGRDAGHRVHVLVRRRR